MDKKRSVLISNECHNQAAIMAEHCGMSIKECVERSVTFAFNKTALMLNNVQYNEDDEEYENCSRLDLMTDEGKRTWPFWLNEQKKIKEEQDNVIKLYALEEKENA